MKGLVFDIQRYSLHDGPGIRTTVFLKGCPLRCQWCHNPEGLDPRPELALTPSLCVGCGRCVNVCPQEAHSFTPDGRHVIFNSDRTGTPQVYVAELPPDFLTGLDD